MSARKATNCNGNVRLVVDDISMAKCKKDITPNASAMELLLALTHLYNNKLLSPGGRFKKTYELLNLRALKISHVNKIHIFQCMGKIFCVEFQRYPLKFHTKYLTHTLKDTIFIQHWNFKSS